MSDEYEAEIVEDEEKVSPSVAEQTFELQERSDQDPHEKFDPEALGMEDWGDGFFVASEPVVIKRRPSGAIYRTIPLSEAAPEDLEPTHWKDGEIIEAPPIEKMKPVPRRIKDKTVHLMAGLLMRYYAGLKPGQIAYNPLYDGIPADEVLTGNWVLQPEKTGANLVHVSADEVHEWLKKLLGARAKLIDNRKKAGGAYQGDLSDILVRFER